MTNKLLTVKEVGEILDLKPARIYELTREKKIPFVQIGERQYRYSAKRLYLIGLKTAEINQPKEDYDA